VRRFRYVVADVFTDTPLTGNQLAVFTDARDLDSLTMQALAKEMNFAESVFVLRPQVEDADVRIRIFTPANELPFAGHPTLGAAFVLGGPLQKIVLRIETGAGVVPVELEREGPKIVFGWMDQPIPPWESFEQRRRAVGGARRAGIGSAGRALPPRAYASLRRARLSRGGGRACA
jgi:trans-2,3-dihydro-3-hydroxyanthranilate isomerase